jgi:hypothetical protein
MLNRTVLVVCVVALAISFMGLIAWVQYLGGDVERILGWFGAIFGPLLASFASILTVRNVHKNVVEVKDDLRVVKVLTDGKMTRMGNRLDELEKEENG